MKIRTMAKALACATAFSVAVCSSAFAAAPTSMDAKRSGSNINVTYSGVTDQMTLFAYDITKAMAALTGGDGTDVAYVDDQETEIVYVTQEQANGTKTFALKDNYAPKAQGETKYLLVKVGGTNIDTPAAKVVTLEYQAVPDVMFGDIDNSSKVDAKDISLVINYYLGDKSVITAGSNAFYAADVDGSNAVDAKDISLMINRYLGDTTPFPAEAVAASSVETESIEKQLAEETPAEEAVDAPAEEDTEEVTEEVSDEKVEETPGEETEETSEETAEEAPIETAEPEAEAETFVEVE